MLHLNEKIKLLAFDFDGVILDSAGIKFEAFDEMFDRFPNYAQQMKDYTRRNAGYSRYVQFRYFFEDLMGLEYSAEMEKTVVGEFSDKVLKKVLNAPYIDGVISFVNICREHGARTYIVTGTPQEDITMIADERGISRYFDGIFGSPELKENILLRIIDENSIEDNKQLMFYGDAMSDYEAAVAAGVSFTGVGSLTRFPPDVRCIQDFTELV